MENSRELVDKVRAGDQRAFADLVRQYQRLVAQIVFRMVPVTADREDICQEVFFKVYQHLPSFRFESKLSTWIGRIACNTSLNFLEKKKLPLYDDLQNDDTPHDAADPAATTPETVFENRELATLLGREIDKLPPVYRTIVGLFHQQELSYEEISQVLKLPEGTVKSYLFRARKMLKKRLSAAFAREDL